MTIKQLFITSFISASILFAFAGTAYAQTAEYDTKVTLDAAQAVPVEIGTKKTEISLGIAQEDIRQLNTNPTPEMIQNFMKTIASEYGVDWKLVYAIGYHESANYNSSLAQRNNNYFGRKASSGGYASWSTPEDGIRNQFTYLKTRYFDRGLTTPATINPVYAEDSSWQFKVESVMSHLN